jgi:hypothetical protein
MFWGVLEGREEFAPCTVFITDQNDLPTVSVFIYTLYGP